MNRHLNPAAAVATRPRPKKRVTIPRPASMPRIASFFAGIGGFDLAFEQSGFVPKFHCEIQEYCQSVLRHHWPDVPLVSDINDVSAAEIPECEVWCGGFPCQDVSVARGWLGRDGLRGRNTGLFYPFASLVKQNLPKVVVMENVTGLLNSHEGRDFSVVLRSFAELGYGVAWRVLNTRYFGAPQSRPRVYICAWHGSADRAFRVLFEKGGMTFPEQQRLGFMRESICERTGARVPHVAFCLAATSGRHTGTDWSRSYVAYEKDVRRLTPTECERIQGFPQNWTKPSSTFRATADRIDSLRYHAIGNAVSVPVAKWVARRVKEEMSRGDATLPNTSLFRTDMDRFATYVPEFGTKKAISVCIPASHGQKELMPVKWPSGGVMDGGGCRALSVSHAPSRPIDSKFVEALDSERPSEQYFLSPNAARGIIRRVESQRRQLFMPLASALERLALDEGQ